MLLTVQLTPRGPLLIKRLLLHPTNPAEVSNPPQHVLPATTAATVSAARFAAALSHAPSRHSLQRAATTHRAQHRISRSAQHRTLRRPACAADSQVTVIVNTFKRPDLLRKSVQHYSQCPAVRRVHVNWAESVTPPDLSAYTCCGTPVTFAVPLATHNDSSLNTRFLPVAGAHPSACCCAPGAELKCAPASKCESYSATYCVRVSMRLAELFVTSNVRLCISLPSDAGSVQRCGHVSL